jgi:hypothetical protein
MGVSRPEWMNDEEWGEYRMTEEYKYDLMHESDYDPYDHMDYPEFEPEYDYVTCACGEEIDLLIDVNECDFCDRLYNAWGQSLKPYDEWEDY